MVTFVTVYSERGMESVILVQHISKTRFRGDWQLALKSAKLKNPNWEVHDVYEILKDMGWSITFLQYMSVSCEEE
jgi:hypothetical protein